MAEDSRGKLLKINGEVHVINAEGESRKADETRFEIRELDTIETRAGGRAVVQFTDGSLTVLDEKSSLRVEKINWLSHLGGKIYFTFRKIIGEPRKVKSKFTTLGIRGTTFIVYDDDDGQSVALKDGQLDVESPGEEYEIHREKVLDEFEAFKQQAMDKQAALQNEFDEYKKTTMNEFVEYKKSFTLESNHVIHFDGNRVDETKIDQKIEADFEDFESEAGEMLREFRQQSEKHRESLESGKD